MPGEKKTLKQKMKDNAPELVFWGTVAATTVASVGYVWWAISTNTPVSADTVESATKTVTKVVYKSGRVFTQTYTKAIDVAEAAAEVAAEAV